MRAKPFCAVAGLTALVVYGALEVSGPATRTPAVVPSHVRRPAAFVPNVGHWQHPARFVHRRPGMNLFVEERGWILELAETNRSTRRAAVRMTFEGECAPAIEGEQPLRGHHNYFIGSDESRWRTSVPLYESVLFRGLYPSIDVRLREALGRPEYDLLLEPGADLTRVCVRVEGARSLRVGGDGSLVIETDLGPLVQPLPATWSTDAAGERTSLDARFVLLGPHRFGFEVPGWDGMRSLTIDPGLIWATLLGGSGWDEATSVSVDVRGIVTVCGTAWGLNFPTTTGAYQRQYKNNDAFVSQLDPAKSGPAQLVYSTYLGGSAGEEQTRLWAGIVGFVIAVAGTTFSNDFPTTPGAFRRSNAGHREMYVSILNLRAIGKAQLVYSTLLGGTSADTVDAVSMDPTTSRLTVAGRTSSNDFPTTNSCYQRILAPPVDAAVSILDPNSTGHAQLVYSTYLGGMGWDRATCLHVDGRGVITLAGSTQSASFPTTTGAYDTSYNQGGDAFLARLDPKLAPSAQLVYSSYFGGSGWDWATALALDDQGFVVLTGNTSSTDLPMTTGAYDRSYNGFQDAFVARVQPAPIGRRGLAYSTFLGGLWQDQAFGIGVDSLGRWTVVGGSSAANFPTTPGAYSVTPSGGSDAFVSQFDPILSGNRALVYSTFVGASGHDIGLALSVAGNGTSTLVGLTSSTSFPTTRNAYDSTYNGGLWDGFLAQLDMLPTGVSSYGRSSHGCAGLLAMAVTSMPRIGNSGFGFRCSNAPPGRAGLLALSARPLTSPFWFRGAAIWIDFTHPAFGILATAADGRGQALVPLPIPNSPALVGLRLVSQFVWFGPTTPPCPPLGVSASNALDVTLQR